MHSQGPRFGYHRGYLTHRHVYAVRLRMDIWDDHPDLKSLEIAFGKEKLEES